MKARALNYIIFTGCAALTAIILDNDNTLTKQLGSLPPWAAELNQNIDTQVIGKIIKIIETSGRLPPHTNRQAFDKSKSKKIAIQGLKIKSPQTNA